MTLPNVEQMSAFGKDNLDALMKSGTAAAQGLEELAKAYTAFANRTMEQTQSAVKSLSSVTNPAEFQSVYNSIAKQNFETFIAESRKLQEVATQVVSTSFAPIAARFQAAGAPVAPAASKSAK